MEEIINKLKPEEKINFKLDSIKQDNNYHHLKIYNLIIGTISLICLINGFLFEGLFSLFIFFLLVLVDSSSYKREKIILINKYFQIKTKK